MPAKDRTRTLTPGAHLDHYEIVRLIGRGGMGEVYLARDVAFGRQVAIKVLSEELRADEKAFTRLQREGEIVGQVHHPGITEVIAIGRTRLPGSRRLTPYVVMEYVEGRTLRQVIPVEADGRRLVEYLIQVAETMQRVHQAEIIHRDLKPENVMITAQGYAKLLDFGIARTFVPRTPFDTRLTLTGTIRGTAHYMSPEQATGRPLDPRSDIFSFGSMLYEALTGRRAFDGESTVDVLAAVVRDTPLELPDNVGPELGTVVDRCLAKSPEGRFQSMREVAAALRGAVVGWDGTRVPGRLPRRGGPRNVFISYSHDSPEHVERVTQFAHALRRHGIDADLDRFHDPPDEGWPRWYAEQLRPEVSRHVLLICTKRYRKQFERYELWDAEDIRGFAREARFIPVLLDGATVEQIPSVMRGTAYYAIADFTPADPGFDKLYRDLIGQPHLASDNLPTPPLLSARIARPMVKRIAASRLPPPSILLGRDEELAALDAAWSAKPKTNLLEIVGHRGEGKTTLVSHWAAANRDQAEVYFDWSFYEAPTSDAFFASARDFFGGDRTTKSIRSVKRLAQRIAEQRSLLVLDGIETLLDSPTGKQADHLFLTFLRVLATRNQGLCIVTTRWPIIDFHKLRNASILGLDGLSHAAGARLLKNLGVRGDPAAFAQLAADTQGHALTIQLLGQYLVNTHGGDIEKLGRVGPSSESWTLVNHAIATLRDEDDSPMLSAVTFDRAAIAFIIVEAGETARQWAERTLVQGHATDHARNNAQQILDRALEVVTYVNAVHEADAREQSGRTHLANHSYREASDELSAAMSADPARAARIDTEFGFLFRLEPSTDDRPRLRWCTDLWRMLTRGVDGDIAVTAVRRESEPVAEEAAVPPKPEPRNQAKGSQAKGKDLEEAALRLFRRFFSLADDAETNLRVQLTRLRKQKAGAQFGYDLAFEATVVGRENVRCHVECKNYSSVVSFHDIAVKLLQQEDHGAKLDHWILISPHADPDQDLHKHLEKESDKQRYPFDIHVWSPETDVDQFFGLEPALYDKFYKHKDAATHPRNWKSDEKLNVVERYRNILRPVYRLPEGWKEYVERERHLCFSDAERLDFERTYSRFVPLGVKDQNGIELSGTSIERLLAWLDDPSQRVAFVLGEFGDGKSFLTYSLCRTLLDAFRKTPDSGVIPMRLALREFKAAQNVREFLQARLETFDATPASWAKLKGRHRTLVILDGFDEISKELDPRTITANILSLIDCCTAPIFDGAKILITSRTHFFESGDAPRLLQRLAAPLLLQLGRIPRGQVLGHLQDAAQGPEERELLQRLSQMHDPIGLGTKPLFLQMLKDTLHELPADLDDVTVYQSYARQTLERKIDMLDDPDVKSMRAESVQQLLEAHEIIAKELQCSKDPYVSLKNLRQITGPFAELLWRLTGDEQLEKDAEARLGTRSLLSRVKTLEGDGRWLVDFCHRSIREYFVARGFAAELEQGPGNATTFLQRVPVNHEILSFTASLLRRSRDPRASNTLRELIAASSPDTDHHGLGGKALTVLLRVTPALPRDLDFRRRNFDYADMEDGNLSGLDFSGSTFRGANFANANIEHANLSHCDLTDVRLHETTSVLAVVAPSADKVFAGYEDGTIWEWNLGDGGKPAGRIVFSQPGLRLSRLGVTKHGIPWAIAGRETLLFDMAPAEWNCLAKLPLHQKTADFHADERNFAVLLADKDSRCLLADLEQQAFSIAVPMPESPAFTSPMASVLCFRSGETSVCLIGNGFDCKIETGNATSLHAVSRHAGEILVAAGESDGFVRIIAVTTAGNTVVATPLLVERVHTGPVLSVMFCDADTVASGGLDRTIAVTRFRGTAALRRQLQLSLRCKGLNTTGLRPETQRKRLEELMSRAH